MSAAPSQPVPNAVRQQLWRTAAAAHTRYLHEQCVRDIVAQHGSLEGWRDESSPQLSADLALTLARILAHLMTAAPGRPRGTVRWERHRRILISATTVATYWASVIEGGDAAWGEERARIITCQRAAAASSSWAERQAVLGESYAIHSLLPYYQHWGWALVEAGYNPDLNKAFLP